MNLLPRPRSVSVGEGTLPCPDLDTIVVGTDPSLPSEGYAIDVAPQGVRAVAGDDAGCFYARATLAQLAVAHGGTIPVCRIRDWPDLAVRGVMLDISRDKVPTMETLETLIDRLASWKVNQVQLYMEHTFAYRDHRQVWEAASPLSAEEVVHLDRYCRDRHVELVPNQNCLGHWDRWLRHEHYRPLAIAPDGWINPGGKLKPPTTLDPSKPGTLALVRSLLSELLECFTSRRINVGLDEPWELPPERFADYESWISVLRALPELADREMIIWGDIVAQHPEVLTRLPDGVTVCEWGYDDNHPFEDRTRAMADAGVDFWVAPGTSSWLSILGRVDNMVGDCSLAAGSALDHGGTGVLNTDWGDMGHLQYLPVSEPGLAYGAAVSWCLEANRDIDLARALSTHAYADDSGELGHALVELGNLYLGGDPSFPNVSALVLHLYLPQLQLGPRYSKRMTTESLEGVDEAMAAALARLERARPARPDAALVAEELRAGAELVSLLCRDARLRMEADGRLTSIPEAARRELSGRLGAVMESHRRLWLARNRPGGLDDSLSRLAHLDHCYRSGTVDPDWGEW
jgi:hexosaminidase